MRSRRQRHEDFASRKTGGSGSLSSALLACALSELKLGLDDRTERVHKTADNHFTSHAVGSIALLVDGLEAWLNEAVWMLARWAPKLIEDNVANKPLLCKYRIIPEYVTGGKLSIPGGLGEVVGLRHEIVHWLPYLSQKEDAVPEEYAGLERKGLFITADHEHADFTFEQKLQSYKLAHWCWEHVEAAVMQFVDAVDHPNYSSLLHTASNFSLYKHLHSTGDSVEAENNKQ